MSSKWTSETQKRIADAILNRYRYRYEWLCLGCGEGCDFTSWEADVETSLKIECPICGEEAIIDVVDMVEPVREQS